MLKSGIILLTIFLSSCAKIQIADFQGEMYAYSHKFQRCRKFDFLISQDKIGMIGDAQDVPIEMCDNITGFKNIGVSGKDWPAFRAWLNDVFRAVKDANTQVKPPQVEMPFERFYENR